MKMQNLLEWILANEVTFVMTAIIVLMFLFFCIKAGKQQRLARKIKKALKQEDALQYLEKTRLKPLCEAYRKSICLHVDGKDKTNLPAAEVFSLFETTKAYGINLKLLDVASGTLVGLGLFGTFLGFVIGVSDFRDSTVEEIQQSIKTLMGGMTTAFLTSLVGMGTSLLYSVMLDKPCRNNLLRSLSDLAARLDAQYYIDDLSLQQVARQNEMDQLFLRMKGLVEAATSSIAKEVHTDLTYLTDDGHTVTLAGAIRDILTENRQQTQALKSFSTDLAMELNNGFDEMLSRQMQQKLLPLMESIDATTRAVVAHIDQMAEKVAAPANEMMTSVTNELKQSLTLAMNGFQSSLSESTRQELEHVTAQLNATVAAMQQLPSQLEGVTQTLQATMNDVQTAVAEMSTTSRQANNAATQQMQEQLNCITATLGNVMDRLRTVMDGIAQTSEEKNREITERLATVTSEMTERLAGATSEMGHFLQQTIEGLGHAVQTSVNNMADHVTNQQADLLALQEGTTGETRRLVEAFNQSLQRQEELNGQVNRTLEAFGQAHGEIAGSTANLKALTQEMKTAAERLSQAQTESNRVFESIQRKTQEEIEALTGLMSDSDQLIQASEQLSEDNVQKFDLIQSGLATIFSQLQSGLAQYSETVRTSTQKYLEGYSTSLTKVAENLNAAIERQNDATEMLSDSLDAIFKGK